MSNKVSKKAPAKSIVQKLNDYYTIKDDGAVTLDLAKAAKSEAFKEGIRRIRQHDLTLKQSTS